MLEFFYLESAFSPCDRCGDITFVYIFFLKKSALIRDGFCKGHWFNYLKKIGILFWHFFKFQNFGFIISRESIMGFEVKCQFFMQIEPQLHKPSYSFLLKVLQIPGKLDNGVQFYGSLNRVSSAIFVSLFPMGKNTVH